MRRQKPLPREHTTRKLRRIRDARRALAEAVALLREVGRFEPDEDWYWRELAHKVHTVQVIDVESVMTKLEALEQAEKLRKAV